MTTKKKSRKVINKEVASKILRRVPYYDAFYFFTDIGQYRGQLTVSLADFCKKIEIIDVESIDFHFKRRDFEEWIRATVGDADLADEISRISKSLEGEELRDKIHQAVERRVNQLKRLLASEEAYLEHF